MNVCRDTSDAVPLYLPQRLYLKPTAKINVSVQLPPVKVHGKTISNWDLMEKLRKAIQPESFSVLKVSKNSLDVIRFDAEIDNRDKLERVIACLDDRTVKLNDYPDSLKVRASEAKVDFPSRHSWDSFFRDAPNMDEMKPGERPDTIYLANLPIKWFVSHRERNDDDALPNESIFRKVFEKFGKIRHVDVPLSDPFRKEMKPHMTGIQAHGSDSQVFFEGYVQFSEYVAFVRAMDALRGKKLLRRSDDLSESVSVVVDFDKTKHMTDAAIKRRAIVRDRLAERLRAKQEKEKEERDNISKREEKERLKAESSERQKLELMREREERRKKKQLAKLMARERGDVKSKVVEEERRLVATQRRLQAIRLMEELFRRIEIKNMKSKKMDDRYSRAAGEQASRERCVRRIKHEQEQEMDKQRQRLQRAYEGSIVLRAVLDTKRPRRRASASSLSSRSRSRSRSPAGGRARRVKKEKMSTPEREQEMRRVAGMYPAGVAPFPYPYQFPAPHYPYQQPAPPMDMFYGVRGGGMGGGPAGAYYPPPPPAPEGYAARGRYAARRARGGRPLYRGGPRMPYFEGPNASHEYYKYFKRLSEAEHGNEHDDRARSRTRSRSRSRRRSYTRSRSRSRRRRRSRSRSSSRSRSRSRRRRSYSRSRSHSRRRSRSRSHSRSRSRRRSTPERSARNGKPPPESKEPAAAKDGAKERRSRSKSWSLPKEPEKKKSWSKSPKEQ